MPDAVPLTGWHRRKWAPRSEPSATCLPSRRSATLSMHARMCSRSASCCIRCCRGPFHSRLTRRSRCCASCTSRIRSHLRPCVPRCRRPLPRSSLGWSKKSADLAAFEKAVELSANSYLYWGNLGDGYRWASGRRGEAAAAYRRASELIKSPDCTEAAGSRPPYATCAVFDQDGRYQERARRS